MLADISLTNASDFREYKPFFNAVWSGDWNVAKDILDRHPNALRARIPYSGKTALHAAVGSGKVHIVQELVQRMPEEDLEIQGADHMTALAAAVDIGITEMAKCMVNKNNRIVSIVDARNMIPVVLAFTREHLPMASYLYSVTPIEDLMPDKGPNGATVVCQSIYVRRFGKIEFEIHTHKHARTFSLAACMRS